MKARFKLGSARLRYQCCRQARKGDADRAMEMSMLMEFVRSGTIVMMGITVMAAAVFVVMYG